MSGMSKAVCHVLYLNDPNCGSAVTGPMEQILEGTVECFLCEGFKETVKKESRINKNSLLTLFVNTLEW